ncbi:hypothetical protein IKQ26_05250 [bacterium]|nr:hypothetical protein [bacterium]
MSIYLILLILLLTGGAFIQPLLSFICFLIIAVFFVFLWEYRVFVSLVAIFVFLSIFLFHKLFDYLKHKDETDEERNERIENQKMINEWKGRNHF